MKRLQFPLFALALAFLKYTAAHALDLDDTVYLAAKNDGLTMVRNAILALFAKDKLDAIIYPTSPRPATLIDEPRRRDEKERWQI